MNDLIHFYKHWASEPRGGWDKVNITKHDGVYYVHIALLERFLDTYAKNEKNIVLVTEGSDLCIHENHNMIHIANTNLTDRVSFFDKKKVANIKYWFSTNNNSKTLSVNSIPCGFWRKINTLPEPKSEKKNRILLCCNINNNIHIRLPIFKKFSNDKNVDIIELPQIIEDASDWSKTTEAHKYLLDLVNEYKYVICPESNGIDTNRLWECSILNSIPLTNPLYFYRNIEYMTNAISTNLLEIDTEVIINNNYIAIDKKEYLTNQYWLNAIEKALNTDENNFVTR